MLRGLYTAAAGMITQQMKHDTATNNIANLNTPGFKRGSVSNRAFPEMLISLIHGEDGHQVRTVGRLNSGVLAEENIPGFQQGDLEETGNASDFGIASDIRLPGVQFDAGGKALGPDGQPVYQPQAFFTLFDNNDELRYTRDGKFSLNSQGQLVSPTGYRVLGADGQPIVLDRSMDEIRLSPDGAFLDAATGLNVQDANGNPVQLLISRVDNPNDLIREGDGNYRLDPSAAPSVPVDPAEQVRVKQGFIEKSNVDPVAATVDMMTALRAYEANQRVVQFYDRSLDKAVNEVGRV